MARGELACPHCGESIAVRGIFRIEDFATEETTNGGNRMIDIFFQEDDGTLVKTLIHKPEGKRFNVNLVLKNETKAEVRFVKVEVDFQRTRRMELVDIKPIKIFQEHQYAKYWKANTAKQTRLQALFNGGMDFVLFPDDSESIGRFVIRALDDIEQEEITIPYCIRAQGLEKRTGKLKIIVEKNLTEEEIEVKLLKEMLQRDPGNEYAKKRLTHVLNVLNFGGYRSVG